MSLIANYANRRRHARSSAVFQSAYAGDAQRNATIFRLVADVINTTVMPQRCGRSFRNVEGGSSLLRRAQRTAGNGRLITEAANDWRTRCNVVVVVVVELGKCRVVSKLLRMSFTFN